LVEICCVVAHARRNRVTSKTAGSSFSLSIILSL
jgi:hypothetical protein